MIINASRKMSWRALKCTIKDINLDLVLPGGQSFRWHKNEDRAWHSVLFGKLWYLKQDAATDIIYYQVFEQKNAKQCDAAASEELLHGYFQLNVSVPKLYAHWCSVDENIKRLHDGDFAGVRVLRQDPVENLFSFICSQNNNVKRISQLVDKLCGNFGEEVSFSNGETRFTFPSVESLAKDNVESTLRKLSFGYRAKFIAGSAQCIVREYGGVEWLYGLREKQYEEAHVSLCSLPGVGAKVADCVCLMSLDKTAAVPVDTHMFQVAKQQYLPKLNKTLTDKTYKEIGGFFRNLYGEYSGWAHSVLFTSSLNSKKSENIGKRKNSTLGKENTKKSKKV